MTPNCVKLFEDLQDLYCFACNPSENYYVDSKNKKIYLCEQMAQSIWFNFDIYNYTTAYDKCGFKVPQVLSDLTSKNYIVPSHVKFLGFYLNLISDYNHNF